MTEPTAFPPGAFDKADPSADPLFYAEPRFVAHIDDGAIAAVTDVYRRMLPKGGVILDLMSSWISHFPEEMAFSRVIGHGMNAEELAANPRLDEWFVQDLNANPTLPLASSSADAGCLCVSVQYLQQPVAVFREAARVLRPGGPLVVTFSNRCFPTKAVAIWQALSGEDQQRLVSVYFSEAGFERIETDYTRRPGSDPIWAVVGRAPGQHG